MSFILQRRMAAAKKDSYIPLPKAFSVAKNKQVYFSQGNLQYQASTNTWRFAEHQWDYVGEGNNNISSSYEGWIDLFGWGTSGWDSGADCYQPWSTSNSFYDYYPGGGRDNSLIGDYANADWGVYNPISNGGNQAGLWRTLTWDELNYLLNTRLTKSGIRYAMSCMNNINGLILAPDDWNSQSYIFTNANNNHTSFNSNIIDLTTWNILEQEGMIFLPVCGIRTSAFVGFVNSRGCYFSSSSYQYTDAYQPYKQAFGVLIVDGQMQDHVNKSSGCSVRLVKDAIIPENGLLTFVANEDNSIIKLKKNNSSSATPSIEYTRNCKDWQTLPINTNIILKKQGDWIQLRGVNTSLSGKQFVITGSIAVSGDLTSLLNNIGGDYAFEESSVFYYLFAACNITTAPNLPTTTLTASCYEQLFKNCTQLTKAPDLPATTMQDSCYEYMFQGCTGLTETPKLNATVFANECYYGIVSMTNLLPDVSHIDFTDASVVASGVMMGLFCGTNVTNSDLYNILPIDGNDNYYLPVMTLTELCYVDMFRQCTQLTKMPYLPATTMANQCYQAMFYGCNSLTDTYELPATTLAQECYNSMFAYCLSLITAPQLPALTMQTKCYSAMFYGCSSLINAPSLPATTLARYCYQSMFNSCTSLTHAPDLNVVNLGVYYPYNGMFQFCDNLIYIKCLSKQNGNLYTYNWITGGMSGDNKTFVKHPDATWAYNNSGVPNGWTIVDATL